MIVKLYLERFTAIFFSGHIEDQSVVLCQVDTVLLYIHWYTPAVPGQVKRKASIRHHSTSELHDAMQFQECILRSFCYSRCLCSMTSLNLFNDTCIILKYVQLWDNNQAAYQPHWDRQKQTWFRGCFEAHTERWVDHPWWLGQMSGTCHPHWVCGLVLGCPLSEKGLLDYRPYTMHCTHAANNSARNIPADCGATVFVIVMLYWNFF